MDFNERLAAHKRQTGTTYESMAKLLGITYQSFSGKMKNRNFRKAEKLALEAYLLKEKTIDADMVSIAEVHVNGYAKDVYKLNMSTVNAITLFNSVNTIGGREVQEIKLTGDKLVVVAKEGGYESKGK